MGCFETAIPEEDREPKQKPKLVAKNFKLVTTVQNEGVFVSFQYKDPTGNWWWLLGIDEKGTIVRYSGVPDSIGFAVTSGGVVKMSGSV